MDGESKDLSENYIKTAEGDDFCEFTDEWIGVRRGVEESANKLRAILDLPKRKYWEERIATDFANP